MRPTTRERLRVLFSVATLLSIAALTACGGGSSETPAPPPPPAAPASTNINAAYLAAMRQTHTYELAGPTSAGVNVSASLSIAPGAAATYNGISYDTTTLTTTVTVAGSPASTAVTTLWLQPASSVLVFETSSSNASCLYVSSQSALPVTATVGQAGPYITATRYPGCTVPGTVYVSIGTVTQTWSYTSVSGIGFACLTTSDAQALGTSTEQDCFEVTDANGSLGSRARVTIRDLDGVTTTLATH